MDGADLSRENNAQDAVVYARKSDTEAEIDKSACLDPQSDTHPLPPSDPIKDLSLEGEDVVMQSKGDDNEVEVRDPPMGDVPVLLYCRRNGRSHQVLLDFGLETCPKCGGNLINKSMLSDSSHAASDSSSSTNDSIKPLDKSHDGSQITFAVEYTDQGNYAITTEPWNGPFELATARKGIETDKKSPIEVVTVLKTTIPEDSRRYRHEVRDLMDDGILTNPSIGVTVRCIKMVINSQAILQAIKAVVPYYPSVCMEGQTIKLEEPFPLIAHYMSELEKHSDSSKKTAANELACLPGGDAPNGADVATDGASSHLDLLLDFVKTHIYKDNIVQEKERYTRMRCTFRMLWLLFKPGETVYCEYHGRLAAYVIQDIRMDPGILSKSPDKSPYVIRMWSLDFDGDFVGRCNDQVTIPQFEGERSITTLKVFPSHYLDDQDGGKTRGELERYGKRWYELLTGGQVYYSGKLLCSQNKDCHGRVYVDNSSYYSEEPDDRPDVGEVEDMGEEDMGEGLSKCPCEDCKGRRIHPPFGFRWACYDVLDPRKDKDLETDGLFAPARHRYLLCSRKLHGLVLKTRTWETLDIVNCRAPKENKQAIRSLVMPEKRKELIEALVQKYSGNRTADGKIGPWRADHMENKGEGQIFLLHGGPGVGKTFCIAEYTGRALLSLTVGDIGAEETHVEKNLTKWFNLAETWGAVILIDEADVYLERRSISDLKRNALVSVFLRCIEYYRGILFLTTNRVGTFDDAFVSRIHVVIAYDNLGRNERDKIWGQFFDKLSEDRQDMTITRRAKTWVLEDPDMVNVNWNGREIRNAFQTAVALAEYRCQMANENEGKRDQPVLDQRDFEQVLEMASQFKKYLAEVHGSDEDLRAFQARTRAWNPSSTERPFERQTLGRPF